jgi:cell wall-associated NlpC family hydrolase
MGSKIENAHIAKFKEDELLENETIDFNNIVPSALAFLGTPYLWGGRTIWGIDCSGFVQTIFGGNGYQLPRDAYQQQEVGIEVDFEDADKNDLAFFANKEGKIVHVGLILDNKKRIIHASGEVRIDTLDNNGILVSGEKKYSHVLHSIKRVIYQ